MAYIAPKEDYKMLYQLQNRVLDIIFAVEKEFYLTGGTCLHRFYKEKRYSDDLDFFTHQSTRFSFAIKNIRLALEKGFTVSVDVESKNFVRFWVDKKLQLDFVNDVAYRYKDIVVLENGYILDNIENILSNKLTAVMGRDNPKDIIDVFLIWKYFTFSWKEMLEVAQKKMSFSNDDLIIRFETFPKGLLDKINLTDPDFLENFETEYPELIKDITRFK